ncbi:Ig-like domain-containing protein [Colwellia sp. 20A7]|uniref:Ig-like domain-containing protein n=1 Tax=Colwellia sp. 20A7 TaxID=2689569 RepID=UPI001359C2C2|nr:Ig-like domain-containing protein [Colwellia sp. 20A7]
MELLRRFSFTLLLMTLTTLVACGGGGEGFSVGGEAVDTTDPDSTTVAASSITLLASSQQLASSGAEVILLTAIAKDADNNLLEGVSINFSSTSGDIGFVIDDEGNSITSDVTGTDGKVVRNLATETDSKNRVISVSVKSDSVSDNLDILVVGTTISLTGSSVLAVDDVNNYTVKLLDSDGNGLAGALVDLSLSGIPTEVGGNVANITLPTGEIRTDANGQVQLTVAGTSEGTNSLIASAFGATVEEEVSVQADTFLITGFSNGSNAIDPSVTTVPDVPLSETASITLTWLRAGVPVDGTVSFTATRGSLEEASVVTEAGQAVATLTSNNAGKVILTFIGTTNDNGKVIELHNQLEFEFVADEPHRLIAQAFPISIGPNQQTSTISVIVRDSVGNLVKNQAVDFDLDDVTNGSIYPASAVTDSNGGASTVYTSNSTSAHDGITIKAKVRGASPEISDAVNITVADREVFIALGTGNTILQSDINTYNKQYSVFVTDIDSNPIPNIDLTVSAIPKEYTKGLWQKELDESGEFISYVVQPFATCANEDININGILDDILYEEDINGDGQLTPGNIVNAKGTVTTDEQGRALIDIEYAEVYGGWVKIELIVSTRVKGTESFANALFNLSVLSEDVLNENVPPAAFIFPTGPFGSSSSCSDAN